MKMNWHKCIIPQRILQTHSNEELSNGLHAKQPYYEVGLGQVTVQLHFGPWS